MLQFYKKNQGQIFLSIIMFGGLFTLILLDYLQIIELK